MWFSHSRIIPTAVTNCISLLIISSKARSCVDIRLILGRAAVVAMDILTHSCGFGSRSWLPWRGNAQACISQAERLVSALATNLPLAHVLPAQDEGDTHSLALLYSSPTF